MARPAITGSHVVPKEVSALKPKSIPCDIKVIVSTSKTSGTRKHYYVYESARTGSGKIIGKIEGGKFCPNARGIQLLRKDGEETNTPVPTGKESADPQDCRNDVPPVTNLSHKELDVLQETAVNLNVSIEDIAFQLKDYGEYAMVLASTGSVLEKLEKHFSDKDARLIYVLSVIYFIQEYTPASYVKDVFDASVLSNKWPTLAISENNVGAFLKALGRHPAICDKYSQDLIDEASGLTAIDGHVILTCSKNNDLADYGNKYPKIGNKQLNVLQSYDAINKVPLTSTAYEGSIPDKISVQDLLEAFRFPSNTTFLVDMGFYSEEDIGLYREGNKHFVIPVPDNAIINKAMRESVTFTGRFDYKKLDENGEEYFDKIYYKESTVRELEDAYKVSQDKKKEQKWREEVANTPPGEKPGKCPRTKVNHSEHGEDRIIMFRDEDMHDKMVAEYRYEIGRDEKHSEEELARIGPEFGLIIIRTNLSKDTVEPSVVYSNYKKRWTIEIHYNFVENTIKFCGLKTSDYCSMQGLCFLMITVGQIKAAFVKQMRSSSLSALKNASIKECLAKAGRFKLVQRQDKRWCVSMETKSKIELLQGMGVNVADDLKRLNMAQF